MKTVFKSKRSGFPVQNAAILLLLLIALTSPVRATVDWTLPVPPNPAPLKGEFPTCDFTPKATSGATIIALNGCLDDLELYRHGTLEPYNHALSYNFGPDLQDYDHRLQLAVAQKAVDAATYATLHRKLADEFAKKSATGEYMQRYYDWRRKYSSQVSGINRLIVCYRVNVNCS